MFEELLLYIGKNPVATWWRVLFLVPGEVSKTSDSELSDAEASQMMVKVWMFGTLKLTRLDGVSTKLFEKCQRKKISQNDRFSGAVMC